MSDPTQPQPRVAEGTTLLDAPAAPSRVIPPVPASQDPVATYYCKTLDEVRAKTYDVVIVGGGAVGSAVSHALLSRSGTNADKPRVLLLEKGSFLLPEHVQNLHPQYQRLMADAVAKPWRLAEGTSFDLAPQIPYLGGRALFWSTWIPQPQDDQMQDWPQEVLKELKEKEYWEQARSLLGSVVPSDMGPAFSTFQPKLLERLVARLKDLPHFRPSGSGKDLEIPLASRATKSQLGYRKFSPAPLLLQDADEFAGRFDLVTGCEVQQIRHVEGPGGLKKASELVTSQGRLPLHDATLVLANGVVEPTGLLLKSFAGVLPDFAGTNLGGHVASWFSVQVPRTGWTDLGDTLQVGCTYLKGRVDGESKDDSRDFHIHLMGASNPHPESAVEDLYRLIPDSFDQEFLSQLSDKDHIGFLVHCLGEWRSKPKDTQGSTVRYTADATVLSLRPSAKEITFRDTMDEAAQALVKKVLDAGGDASRIRYWHPGEKGRPGAWKKELPPGRKKDVLVHESGTLWMGKDAGSSVTDLNCRLHTVSNVYVGGAATFPTSGSWNPTLAAVALGQRLADHLLGSERGGT